MPEEGDGTLPHYIKLNSRDLANYEEIKAAFPWRPLEGLM